MSMHSVGMKFKIIVDCTTAGHILS